MEAVSARARPKKYSAKKQLILQKALELVSRNGLEQTGLKEIAAALDMRHSALYYYFESKDQLVSEAVILAFETQLEALEREASQSHATSAERLSAIAVAQVGLELQARSVVPFVNAFLYGPLRDTAEVDSVTAAHITALQRRVVDLYAGCIIAGQANGEFRAGPPKILALGVLGILSYTVFWYREGGKLSVEAIAHEVARQALASVTS